MIGDIVSGQKYFVALYICGVIMKLALLLVTFLGSSVLAQPIQGTIIDLNDSQFVEDRLIQSYIERAERENHYDAIDGRFGGQKPLTYYVDQYYVQKAKDEALRASEPFNQMLNDALQAEDEIRNKLAAEQAKFQNAVLTLFQWNDKIGKLEQRLIQCKKSKGRKC